MTTRAAMFGLLVFGVACGGGGGGGGGGRNHDKTPDAPSAREGKAADPAPTKPTKPAEPAPAPSPAPSQSTGKNDAGTYKETLTVDGMERHFIVYVPASAAGKKDAPVVYMLHGTNQNGQHYYDESKWNAKADEVGALIVYPDSLTYCYHEDTDHNGKIDAKDDQNVSEKWTNGGLGDPNIMPLCTPAEIAALVPNKRALVDHGLKDDENFLDALQAHMASKYAVDTKREYVSGFSNGASFAQRLLIERSDRFAAFAANSAQLNIDPKPCARPASLYFTMGSKDAHMFPPDALPLPMEEGLVNRTDMSSRFVQPLLASMEIKDKYTFDVAKAGPRRIMTWSWKAKADARLEFHIVEGLAHVYPDEMPTLLWDFFKDKRLP